MRLRKAYPENPCTLVLGSVKIKSACYLKTDRELPENPVFDLIPESELNELRSARGRGYRDAQQDMLTPDSQGIRWASVREIK